MSAKANLKSQTTDKKKEQKEVTSHCIGPALVATSAYGANSLSVDGLTATQSRFNTPCFVFGDLVVPSAVLTLVRHVLPWPAVYRSLVCLMRDTYRLLPPSPCKLPYSLTAVRRSPLTYVSIIRLIFRHTQATLLRWTSRSPPF